MPLLFWWNILSLSFHLYHSALCAQARQHFVSWLCQGFSLSVTDKTPTFYLIIIRIAFLCTWTASHMSRFKYNKRTTLWRLLPWCWSVTFFSPFALSDIIPLSWVAKVKAHPSQRNTPPANWIIKPSTFKCSKKIQNDSSGYIFNSLHFEQGKHLLRECVLLANHSFSCFTY